MYALLPYGSCPQLVTVLMDVKSVPLRNKNTKLLLVYSLISNTIRKITYLFHPAGDVTRVSVMLRKVTVKIGDAENRYGGCRDKNP